MSSTPENDSSIVVEESDKEQTVESIAMKEENGTTIEKKTEIIKTSDQASSSRKRKFNETCEDEEETVDQNEHDDSYVTMLDVLEEEQKLEDEAFALLGGSDDKNCTYLHGYVNRQALYACKTCRQNRPETMDQADIAGICLACSYACHEGHDLYELYTKRNFKCDCGNSKMVTSGSKCTLFANKSAVNDSNVYNHNFFGRYCLCDRPYPDPERDNSEVMVQCVVCEDWYHDHCLKTKFPTNDDFGELICGACMNKHPFLWNYHQKEIVRVIPSAEKSNVDIETIAEMNTDTDDMECAPSCSTIKADKNVLNPENAATDSGIESSCDSVLENSQCKLKQLSSSLKSPPSSISSLPGATFWEEGWRKRLCKCNDCLTLYRQQNVEFLYDESDTVHFYEQKAKENNIQISHYERGLNEITKMDRVQSIEAITECDNMTFHFKEFLKKFAESKKVVRQEDIEQFFEELKSRKRPKFELPYSCR